MAIYYIVSGGFDPIHEGHIAMIKEAASASDGVIVLVNSDDWLRRKKGKNFQSFETRQAICENLKGVICAIGFDDKDNTASMGILKARTLFPNDKLVFANGGDRSKDNIPETDTCLANGVEMVFGIGGENKANSSSWILNRWQGESGKMEKYLNQGGKMLSLYKMYIKRSAEAKYMYINKIVGKKKYWFEKYGFKFFYRYFKWRFLLTKKPSLFHIEYKLTSLCTLKCKDCCHNTPYFKENLRPVSFETFKKEIDKLLKSVDKIYVLSLIGGESLLNNDLYKMVRYARSKKQILFVDITTNATIIPKENLINELKNKKDVFVWISDYSSNKKLLPKLKQKELIDIFEKNNIKYIFSDFEEKVTPSWLKPPIVCRDKINKTINIIECRLSNCHTYAEGNIYLCPLQFFMKKSEKYNFSEDEFVDVLNDTPKKITEKILHYYTKTEFEFCKYCKQPTDKDYVLPAIQVNEESDDT